MNPRPPAPKAGALPGCATPRSYGVYAASTCPVLVSCRCRFLLAQLTKMPARCQLAARAACLARRLAARPIGSMFRWSRSATSTPPGNRHAVALPVEAVGEDDLALRAGGDGGQVDDRAHPIAHPQIELISVGLGEGVRLPQRHCDESSARYSVWSVPTSTGTEVTTVFGRYSRRALRANADWLCSHWVFHCVTNSGMMTVITSSGLSASISSR